MDLHPKFEAMQAAGEAVLDHNKAAADESTQPIAQAVTQAKAGVLLSIGVGLVVAFCFGFRLLRRLPGRLDGWSGFWM